MPASARPPASRRLPPLPVDHRAWLREEVAALKADTKHLADLLHDALHACYGAPADAARRAEGKDISLIRIASDAFGVVADLPKRAAWEQPRLTLHGLRATGPVALKMMGWENLGIRSLTGHDSDRSLEVYLQGVESYPLAQGAHEARDAHFGKVLDDAAAPRSNQRRFVGLTGRAAAKARGESADCRLWGGFAENRECLRYGNHLEKCLASRTGFEPVLPT